MKQIFSYFYFGKIAKIWFLKTIIIIINKNNYNNKHWINKH